MSNGVVEEGLQFSPETKLLEEIGKWRARRSRLIERNKGPVSLANEVTTLLHIIPAHSLVRRAMSESWSISEQERHEIYVPHGGTTFSYNEDGFIGIAGLGEQGAAFGYTQIFRSGIIEYANNNCYGSAGQNLDGMVLGQTLEQEIVRCYGDSIIRTSKRHAVPPIYLGFSLIGIAGRRIFSTFRQSIFQSNTNLPVRNIFNSPEFVTNFGTEEDSPYAKTLLPLVDLIWHVFGRARTPFISEGVWHPFGNYQ